MDHFDNLQEQFGNRRRRSTFHQLVRVALFVLTCVVGASYYSTVLSLSQNDNRLLRYILIFIPILLLVVGMVLVVIAFSITKFEPIPSSGHHSLRNKPHVSQAMRNLSFTDSVMYQFAQMIAPSEHAHNTVGYSERIDINEIEQQLEHNSTPLLPFQSEIATSLRELKVTVALQQERLKNTISIQKAISEIELVAVRLREMGATLYRISEHAPIKWLWARDLANPGPFQPLQPIILPSDNTKVNTDQLRRIRDGLSTLDAVALTSINSMLKELDSLNSIAMDTHAMSQIVAEYYVLTERLLNMELNLRNILYEQYTDNPAVVSQ